MRDSLGTFVLTLSTVTLSLSRDRSACIIARAVSKMFVATAVEYGPSGELYLPVESTPQGGDSDVSSLKPSRIRSLAIAKHGGITKYIFISRLRQPSLQRRRQIRLALAKRRLTPRRQIHAIPCPPIDAHTVASMRSSNKTLEIAKVEACRAGRDRKFARFFSPSPFLRRFTRQT